MPLEQQPSGHEISSHWQTPPTQCLPTEHIELLPQRQSPYDEQVSARTGSQATHISPSVPQVSRVRVWHTPSRQQPLGQENGSQTQQPLTQCWPGLQAGPLPH